MVTAKNWGPVERSAAISSSCWVSIRTQRGIDSGPPGTAGRTGNGKLLETTTLWKQSAFVEEGGFAGKCGI